MISPPANRILDRYGCPEPRTLLSSYGVRGFLDSLVAVVAEHMDLADDSLYMSGATVRKVCRAGLNQIVECRFTSVDDHGERRMCSIFDIISIFFSLRFSDNPPWELIYHRTNMIQDIIVCGDVDRFEKDFAILKLTENTLMYDLAVNPSSE